MRHYIGRGLMLSAMISCIGALFLDVRPGKELVIAAGSACLFFIGWYIAGGKK